MGQIFFYHLTRSAVEAAAATLLGKCLEATWTVELRGGDPERLRFLDEKLWLGPKEGFLPHGMSGGDHDALQPVLLCGPGQSAAGARTALMAVDGAEVAPEEVAEKERVLILFDGGDGEALARAREQWKALTEAGCGARYWSEESGRWAEKASKNI